MGFPEASFPLVFVLYSQRADDGIRTLKLRSNEPTAFISLSFEQNVVLSSRPYQLSSFDLSKIRDHFAEQMERYLIEAMSFI